MEGFALVRGCYLKLWKLRWICLTSSNEIIIYKTREKIKLYRLYRVLKDSDVVKHDNIADKTNILLFSNSHGLALYFSLQSSDLKDIWFDAIWDSIRRLQGAVDNSLQTIRFAPHIATAESSDGGIYLESYATKRGHFRGSWKVRLLRLERGTITYFDRLRRLKGKIVLHPHTSVSRHPDMGPYRNLIRISTAKEKGLVFSLESFDLKELWMKALKEQIAAFNQQDDAEETTIPPSKVADSPNSRSPFVSPKRLANRGGRIDGRRQEHELKDGPITKTSSTAPITQQLQEDGHVGCAFSIDLPRLSVIRDDAKDFQQVYDSNVFLEYEEDEEEEGDSVPDANAEEGGGSDDFPVAPPRPEEVDSFIRKTIISSIDQECLHLEQDAQLHMHVNDEVLAQDDTVSYHNKQSSAESDWLEASTEDGKVYYYHRITRLTRWVKPESHIEQASELRIKEAEEVLERNMLERKLELQQLQLKTVAYERIREESMTTIMLRLKEWSTRKEKPDSIRQLSFPELLRDLILILPTDLLLVVYSANSSVSAKTVLHDVRTFSAKTDPIEVKKAYMKTIRFLHPDKVPSCIDVASKLLIEQLFILLTEKYDAFRKAHDL